MKIGPHLHRIGNDIVAAYVIDTEEGVTVIDAGLPGHWRDLRRELAAMGRTTADVRGIVLTHGDSDHVGFAERLRKQTGIPVYVHAADADRAKGGDKPKLSGGSMKVGAALGFFGYALRKGGLRTHYLTEVHEVQDGDVLPLPGAPVVISMPGHSPGSIAVHVPVADAVCVGDALTTRHVLTGRTGPQPAPFTDEPDEALASLARLAAVEASWVLPGHGAPWRANPGEVAAQVRAGGL
ncbi:MAG: MBL fold metallo-hydrolase [Actinobacteria bacterium HGW-Actinobacteria-8]|nr:MAG: MBL fold metallo-hydrolase [Actinobacteria bacterium HGW-Actinobacteria-8]